jgi:hypothetical protein
MVCLETVMLIAWIVVCEEVVVMCTPIIMSSRNFNSEQKSFF